jgi:Na+-transporting NADH:ubiquinone oxidoreductase subunit E
VISTDLFAIFLVSVTTGNIAFGYLLGMCPFISLAGQIRTAAGMGMAVTFVVTITAMVNWPLYHLLLLPWGAEILLYPAFILVIAGTVQLMEMLIERFLPGLEAAFGSFLPLITVNCAVLAVSLFMVMRGYGFFESVLYAFGSSVGWMLAILLVSFVRGKVALIGDVPAGMQGAGITMVITGILALAFLGFQGIAL